jgi:hypothetical protein
MKHTPKVLMTTAIAIVAAAAFSAAAAVAGEFHSEIAHTGITGSQPVAEDDFFTFKAGTVRCERAHYSGTTSSATTSEITVTPTYTLCTAFGFVNTTIDVPSGINGGCDYRYTPLDFGEQPELHIVCGAGEAITITAFNCHVKIGSQTVSSGITYSNNWSSAGWGRDFSAVGNVTGLKYTQESKSFPGCTNGTFEDGKYVGSATLEGRTTTTVQVGIWYE